MRMWVRSVSVGVAIRAMRKASGLRQDDISGVSHVFLRDLEKGKDTRSVRPCPHCTRRAGHPHGSAWVLGHQADAVESAINAHLPKVGSFHTRTYKGG